MHNEITKAVLAEKYLKGEEQSAQDLFKRVSAGIAKAEQNPKATQEWAMKFETMMNHGAIGAGRIMSAGGTDIKATLINCFVQPVGDCITGMDDDGYPGIYTALQEASETMRRGGGVGYDFSRIRPKGAFVKGTHSEASGPCSYMDVFDQSCKTVESAGSRRGAQMGVLRIDHPDVLEFITAKRTPGRWNNFNVSLFVEDAFFFAMAAGAEWELVHKAEPSPKTKANNPGIYQRESDGKWVYAKVNAAELWDTVMRSNYDFAEPGILLGSNINRENNLFYCEKLEASNPCGEQNLPPYGCCDLGQIILPKFVRNPFTDDASLDWEWFEEAARTMVRFLDNVLDVTVWPLEKQREEAMNKRRIGIGFTGLGSTMAMLGLKYSDHLGVAFAETVSRKLRDAVYQASIDLAVERGPFPAYNELYLQSEFVKRLPANLQKAIKAHGIRNSHLLSIAPTGTVSLAFGDNCSNGIEPIFDLSYKRNKRTADGGNEVFHVMDHALRVFLESGDVSAHVDGLHAQAYKLAMLEAVLEKKETFSFGGVDQLVSAVLPESFVTAQKLTVDQHLNVLAAVQPYIDSAISKTINVPADYPFGDFKAIYTKANEMGLKGVACYRPNDILGSVLVAEPANPKSDPQAEAKNEQASTRLDEDPGNVKLSKRPKGDLDAIVKKVSYSGPAGDASMYLTVSFARVQGVIGGDGVSVERPVEVFVTASPDGVPAEWVAAYARNLSLLARSGVEFLSKALQDGRAVRSDKGRVRYGWYEKDDGSKVPRFHSSEVALIAYAVQEILVAKGVLDVDGNPVPSRVRAAKAFVAEKAEPEKAKEVVTSQSNQVMAGKECKECGAHAVIRKDGCDFCTNCGSVGSCG
ncbi:adenosylcobalamin-dependent ribonucleoside-diphosphate reductase [Hydrogenophaga sp. NFH-34]|uniref:adenosylcobalamin-dependent ribonucleoside-diphosphate reductase n=1 Tax=Hydrogenophaga sp. NFH-34 TaxID=2744446 RepID=UPI001F37E468|nr:adenosylcobalamin-dependent ribonucleoside-diphosphate reductase [Hydrogenophaga sp. NFH-34]